MWRVARLGDINFFTTPSQSGTVLSDETLLGSECLPELKDVVEDVKRLQEVVRGWVEVRSDLCQTLVLARLIIAVLPYLSVADVPPRSD